MRCYNNNAGYMGLANSNVEPDNFCTAGSSGITFGVVSTRALTDP